MRMQTPILVLNHHDMSSICVVHQVIYISLSYSHVDQMPILSMAVGWGYKSPKSILDENKLIHGDRTLKNQPNKMGNTFTPSLHLVAFCQLCFVFVCFVFFLLLFLCIGGLWKAVGLVYSAAWARIVHVDLTFDSEVKILTGLQWRLHALIQWLHIYKVAAAAAGGWPAWK